MKKAVILFTRVPKPGVTKTRLLPVLAPEACAELHWAFLRDLSRVYDRVDADLFVSYTEDPDWEALREVFPRAAGFFPQQGADLGEKMYCAIAAVLAEGYDAVVLTGADLPALTAAHFAEGFSALETADVAIGPTGDGGYYLVGMKCPHREVFRVEGYGGASVLENTLTAAREAGLSVNLAPPCDDVDTPEDLRRLAREASPESHTGKFLQKEGFSL